MRLRRCAVPLQRTFSAVDRCSVSTLRAQPRVPSSQRCCPPSISSIPTDHDEVFELPGYPGRAGSLINRPVTIRTIRRFWHPRTGCTASLLLSATTELLIINFVPQHDPQSDPELACYCHARPPKTFLNQFAWVETLQFRIAAYRMGTSFTPEKPQQRTALFCHTTEPLPFSTGIFPRDEPHASAVIGPTPGCDRCIPGRSKAVRGRQGTGQLRQQQPRSESIPSLRIKDLMKTYMQYPPRKPQSAAYRGPITLSNYEKSAWIREQLQKEGISIPLPTGN